MSNSTMAELLVHVWNVWEIQTMVLLSFMLQLFLLATGSLRRRHTTAVLRALIWLGYVGADLVAVYALGLFSQYEDKYKLGKESFGDILPFLWVPFLLVHLGGQDSITAFSIEDNNLWLRHLLNLATQGFVALYIFWKSFHRINASVLIPAMFVFVSGIIKYGERVWELMSVSRNGLGKSVKFSSSAELYRRSKESYARQTVLLARGLFVGRTVLQVGDDAEEKLEYDFNEICEDRGEKLKMVVMELGMMFDLLYTKANVLQRWTGVVFRCASQTLMVAAFLSFLISEKGAHNYKHNSVNVLITYTLFTGAMFIEACSIAVVMASPWTRAHLNEYSSFLHCLCNIATSLFKAVQCNKGHQTMSCICMGQFNYMDYCIAMKYKPRLISMAISAIGLDKQWRNLWYVRHIVDDASFRAGEEGIISGVMEIFGRPNNDWFGQRCLGRRLNYTLSLPFEHALYRLHIYTDYHISRYFAHYTPAPDDVTMRLKEQCETLSNYMMYLMVVHPSMLPVSTAAEDLEPELLKWVIRNNNQHSQQAATKLDFLGRYTSSVLSNEPDSVSPFEAEPCGPLHLEQSLMEMKEMWLRLLVYAAGKCRGEQHARQLSEGGELITFVWLLMVHHGLGDVARELSLLTSNDPFVPQPGSTVSVENSSWRPRQQDPCYAFEFFPAGQQQGGETAVVSREREQMIQLARMVKDIVPQVLRAGQSVAADTQFIGYLIQQLLSALTQHDGATAAPDGTSGEAAGQDDDAVTTSEIHEQEPVMNAVENEGSRHACSASFSHSAHGFQNA